MPADVSTQGDKSDKSSLKSSKGYRLNTLGRFRGCLLVFQEKVCRTSFFRNKSNYFPPFPQQYHEASEACWSNHGHVASTKTLEKLDLVRSFLSTTFDTLWVGLTDVQEEGVYIWDEDWTIMNSTQTTFLFSPGQPTGYKGEDCTIVSIQPDNSRLDDVFCGLSHGFVCEMRIHLV
ncbi:hypothetical protein PoB_001109700 [Plakobranchus ocellatus]|uniref:C-type lectin domain-containing protein n=1 Tax=Plakobranchus ocellatus TaxID=259542 RepID=A0AAV3YR08_9GAST|nr:hypothetical protein PoB_001109700 [Plakobranchus ocellatus]